MKEYLLKVAPEFSGKRLDLFLISALKTREPGLSRTAVQKIILEGKAYLGGIENTKPHHKVKENDEIKVVIEDKKECGIKAEDIMLDVIYEDEDVAVVNKGVGLVVHPAPGNFEHTLVNALLHRFKKISDVNPGRPGIVHRLDKETSGLLVIAKNNASHLHLAEQFAKHSIERKYVAVVSGRTEFDEHVIEASIGRHPFKRTNMSVSFSENSKYARTHYRTLKRSASFSLLELMPFTGRTHQLRVHLAFIGHPILGDVKYGKKGAYERMFLHAKEIGFIHPRTGKLVKFSTNIPEEFLALFNKEKT
ncbi:MAG: RluA family pseudouridine synthase [Candidatus Omnitrophota bacterium]|jgi:23S rRNA pseudouridine1911/1915/1917 synthase